MKDNNLKKHVYFFSSKKSVPETVDSEVLGIRGRLVNEFALLGYPIPPGIVIDSHVAAYLSEEDDLSTLYSGYFKELETSMGKKFNDESNPLLLKIVISPNMAIANYPLLHNFGLARNTCKGFENKVGANFAAHEVLFMVRGMLTIEKQIAEATSDEKTIKQVESGIKKVNELIKSPKAGKSASALMDEFAPVLPEGFFDTAVRQVEICLRRISVLLDKDPQNDDDTAILIQPMVYGNAGKDSGSGFFFTRNIITGEKVLQGQFYEGKFDELDAVGKDINKIQPVYLKELQKLAWKLEDSLKEIRNIRFTIEDKKLWLIEQKSVESKSTIADIKLLLDLNKRKIIDDTYVVKAIKPGQLNEILHPVIDITSVKGMNSVSGGISGAPGAAVGRVYFSTDALLEAHRAAKQKSQDSRCILLMPATYAGDVKAIEVSTGVLSNEGGYSAHASVVARQYGKVSLVYPEMKIKGKKAYIGDFVISEGDYITINVPYYGKASVYSGMANLIEPDPQTSGLLDFIAITKKFIKDFHVRANADSPRDATLAVQFGADGIGLCRTEHMFFNEKRINVFREMILSESTESRIKVLNKLQKMQCDDFYGILKAMGGREVTIRLLDAPLHEFLPHNQIEFDSFVAHLQASSKGKKVDKNELKNRIDALEEFNPMLGHRGCRIAVSYPEIYQMQTKALCEAAFKLQAEKVNVHPEIMVPIIMNSTELKLIVYGKKIEGQNYKGLVDIIEETRQAMKAKPIDFKIGTMIELPAAALGAGDIARYAQFFSFGTNDLTQTTLGLSRDDFNSFMPDYTLFDLIDGNPFAILDPRVKELIEIAVRRGTASRPDLVKGLCGEHGARPENVKFCMEAGLNYISCSSYSVPIALLSIAQLEIEKSGKN